MSAYTPEEAEALRLKHLSAVIQNQDFTAQEIEEKFAPGTFGCHEAMHVASMMSDLVDDRLCRHPAVLRDPDFFRVALEAQEALWTLYQAIGTKHMER
ncbi:MULTISPECIES: hypothetical protein [unclassified Rhizobium]|uniref:hypothetical protein n=1 Tax=unclassified Rhizobium TaxID=2613769 RepID=UPI0006FB448A|nr:MULTISPECIES: hypothetical protein [unclassified Rhizobium]KQV34449.1 hypothetical protein ASC86_16100 [Rhizobium sp. Root1212]KRD25407.1 hypothetical protein ASE37_24825 [Rhizobium sp. Root268]